MDALFERAAAFPWNIEINDDDVGSATTMLAAGELRMLHWLAREHPGDGAIVDAGSFLGGSTMALATGLARRPGAENRRVHAYDMFVTPRDNDARRLIRHGLVPGDSYLHLFHDNIAAHRDRVVVHQGDFTKAAPPDGAIDILFIDVCKSLDLETHMRRHFLSRVTPRRSVIVHQDHNHFSTPWIIISMEHLADYVVAVADQNDSRLFYLDRPIPQHLLDIDLRRDLSDADRIALIDQAIDREIEAARCAADDLHREIAELHTMTRRLGKTILILWQSSADAARRHLREVAEQTPDRAWKPGNIDLLGRVIDHLAAPGALEQWHRNFFLPVARG